MKKILLLLFLCCSDLLFSQQNQIDSLSQLKNVYKDYFSSNRETVYLQLNKTQLLPTEGLWFSAYVFNTKTMKPNKSTSNLHVNVYDGQGKLKQSKTVYIQDGKGEGYFKLDTTYYQPGNYVIKAFTKYMANFKEDLSFKQGFKIINLNGKKSEKKQRKYDLQALPEGGHLLANVNNTVGVKLIDDKGRSHYFSDAKVLDKENKVLTTFKSNRFGIGKFNLKINPDKDYRISVKPKNGDSITIKLPQPEARGLALSINNTNSKTLYLSLRTNAQTRKQITGEKFYIVIHRQGAIESIPVVFPSHQKETTLKIDKNIFVRGVNIITIFNQNFKPLLERQIFIDRGFKRERVYAHLFKNRGDSIFINLSSNLKNQQNRLSISVLPDKTKAYTPKNDIFSSFYIEPFIKGDLENGAYYFSKGQTRRKAYDMDLLLLTQGWSKYNWHHIFKGKPKELYPAEHGFKISGRINKSDFDPQDQVMLKSPNSNLFQLVDLDKKNRFEVDRLFVIDSSEISFALVNGKKKQPEKPKIYARINPLRDTKAIKLQKSDLWVLANRYQSGKKIESFPRDLLQGTQMLDSVFITAPKIVKRKRNKFTSFTTGRYTKIDKDLSDMFPYITDLIEARGFIVHRSMTSVSITSHRGGGSPGIEIDGAPLTNDLDFLLTLKTSEVESISISKTGFGRGINGSGGYIQITTRMGAGKFRKKDSYETTRKVKMKNGFAQNKEFYTPRYANSTSDLFVFYGAIDWFSDVTMNTGSGAKTLKILNTGQPAVKLFIQGMTKEGHLISEKLTVKTR